MKKVAFYIVVLISVISCSKNSGKSYSEICKPVVHIEQYDLSAWPSLKYRSKLNTVAFRPKLLWFKKRNWFAFLSTNKTSLVLFDMQNPQNIDSLMLPIGPKFNFMGNRDSLFWFFNSKEHKLCGFLLRNDSFSSFYSHTIPFPNNEDKYWLSTEFYENTNLSNPTLVLHFGLVKAEKTQYMDPTANFMALVPGEGREKKIGHYPADYFDKKRYYSDALFTSDWQGNIYYTHQLHDSIYKMNDQGKILATGCLDGNPDFLRFNKKKESDMAYIRQYSFRTEMNLNIYCLKNNDVVLIKKLAKDNLKIKNTYKYFVLDSNLTVKYTDTVRHSLYPMFVSDYKNGFLIMSDSLKSAYYYETH